VEDLDEIPVELLRIEELFLQREIEILRDLIQARILREALEEKICGQESDR